MTEGNRFKDGNRRTLEAYQINWQEHEVDLSPLPKEWTDWLDKTVAELDRSARIFEFGSGSGDNALYLESLGYRVDCSEAVPSAVDLLRRRGLSSRQLDALTDDFPTDCQLILAASVIVHFSPAELQLVCDKAVAALAPSGRFGLTTVEGQVQECHQDGHGQQRYFSHLPEADLRAILGRSGFGQIDVEREPINDDVDGLAVIAQKLPQPSD